MRDDEAKSLFNEESTQEESLTYKVGCIGDDFDRATRGVDVAYHVSSALASLQGARLYTRISPVQRDQLLRALFTAGPRIVGLFEQPTQLTQAFDGIEAAATIIIGWAKPAPARIALPSDVRFQIQACARILRNLCHNISLNEEMVELESRNRAKLYGLFGLQLEG